MNYSKWIAHFARNQQDRPEPDWSAPITIRPETLAALLPSLEQFRLGDGGGPASLIAHDAERFRSRTTEMRFLVDRWFAEEAEHARLLGCAVDRFGGRRITSHWSFTAFCLCRRALGVRFELQVLLLTELVSTAYYRLLHRHSPDAPLANRVRRHLRRQVALALGGRAHIVQDQRPDGLVALAGGDQLERRDDEAFLVDLSGERHPAISRARRTVDQVRRAADGRLSALS